MNEKLKAMAHYVIAKSARPLTLEELGSILWLADVEAYKSTGQSITGATYIKCGTLIHDWPSEG